MEEKKPKEDENNILADNLPKDDFTEPQIITLWNELLEKLEKENNKVVLGAIRKAEIRKIKPLEVEILFHSNSSKAEFDKLKIGWLAKVKKTLNNYYIELISKVEVTENNKPEIISNEKIYKKMVEKNPMVEKLRKKLGLDFD